VTDDQRVRAAGSPAHRISDPRLLRTRDQMVNENPEPAPRAGLEVRHDAHQVVDSAKVLDDDALDAQVLAPHLRDEFGVVRPST